MSCPHHECSICDEAAATKKRAEEVETIVSAWFNDLNLFDIYDSIKELDEDEQEELLRAGFKRKLSSSARMLLQELAWHLMSWYGAEPPEGEVE